MPTSLPGEELQKVRDIAGAYEATLDPSRRKNLGQYFTGLPLGRLLVGLALKPDVDLIVDPMAGHGDLLDATIERAVARHQVISVAHAVEIDSLTATECQKRLDVWRGVGPVHIGVSQGDAFSTARASDFCPGGYGLVITNPPYVRYQSVSTDVVGGSSKRAPAAIRENLRALVAGFVGSRERAAWLRLIDSYSGLADLSVPAWILASALVRPGGTLALVVPSTWRSRDYGALVHYLLARFFRVEYLVEDAQPGWFSQALVRTQLVVAKRRTDSDHVGPLLERRDQDSYSFQSVKVFPQAASDRSLVGSAFPTGDPEGSFADWLRATIKRPGETRTGLEVRKTASADFERDAISAVGTQKWLTLLEPTTPIGSLFVDDVASTISAIPETLRPVFAGVDSINAVSSDQDGISISQGLRTGCNGFFYSTFVAREDPHSIRVRLSELFGEREISVPASCIRPVLRRQSEVDAFAEVGRADGRVFDLGEWVLPEDVDPTDDIRSKRNVMPDELASFVRVAATTVYPGARDGDRLIPELSAVKTNIRKATSRQRARHWYMLPEFGRRHRPDAFVPRINQSLPIIQPNEVPPILVDANFSTVWSEGRWTQMAIKAFFRSSWCLACMEALGTALGGGALKLEATQLTRIPVPVLFDSDLSTLDSEGRGLGANDLLSDSLNRLIVARLIGLEVNSAKVGSIATALVELANSLCLDRQRTKK